MEYVSTNNAPGAIGPYSQAMEAGGVVYVSGQLPIDAATGQMAEVIEEQARHSLENIKHIMPLCRQWKRINTRIA